MRSDGKAKPDYRMGISNEKKRPHKPVDPLLASTQEMQEYMKNIIGQLAAPPATVPEPQKASKQQGMVTGYFEDCMFDCSGLSRRLFSQYMIKNDELIQSFVDQQRDNEQREEDAKYQQELKDLERLKSRNLLQKRIELEKRTNAQIEQRPVQVQVQIKPRPPPPVGNSIIRNVNREFVPPQKQPLFKVVDEQTGKAQWYQEKRNGDGELEYVNVIMEEEEVLGETHGETDGEEEENETEEFAALE